VSLKIISIQSLHHLEVILMRFPNEDKTSTHHNWISKMHT